jgi:hypothetical protein
LIVGGADRLSTVIDAASGQIVRQIRSNADPILTDIATSFS